MESYILKRINLKRKSKPYISTCPELWKDIITFSNNPFDVFGYVSLKFAMIDRIELKEKFGIQCKIVERKKE